ncbi:MAG: caspase family protein [Devosia sp.]
MRGRKSAWIAGLVALLITAAPISADELRGVALVIGQSEYDTLTALTNPKADARAMDDALDALGFDVTRILDADVDRFRGEIADFIDEAKDADVALVYYSGHGIEAGGENYLVPVDADLRSPKAAGESLVPLGGLLDGLARIVPVTIVLLDACRTNAFPPGTQILLPGNEGALEVSATGLEAVRGPTPVGRPDLDPEGLGMVIGFAASPGQPALDGEPGGNSPYAAALLKHIAAGGYSFGDLMILVTEEVYLKTKARQLPWTSSSLRRVLSFGTPVEAGEGDEAAIREGRRQLLLSIAAAPDTTRRYVEAVAQSEDVPLDALYGMLKMLGVDASDPGQIEQKLAEGADRLKVLIAETATIDSSDDEILRLSEFAARAEAEGAISVALEFRNRASARAAELSAALDTTQKRIDDRRRELAATFASNGATAIVAFDFEQAAARYRQAYDEVSRVDLPLALRYQRAEADALQSLGEFKGDNDALDRAIAIYASALKLADKEGDPDNWGALQNNMGRTLRVRGQREADPAHLVAAVEALEAALTARTRERVPFDGAVTKTNLGGALTVLGGRRGDNDGLEAAVAAYRDALEVQSKDRTPLEWATTQNNLGAALQRLGERLQGTDVLEQAIAAYRAAFEVRSGETTPYYWATTQQNLGTALTTLGKRADDVELFASAAEAFNNALSEWTRERVPLDWAMAETSLGGLYQHWGSVSDSLDLLERAEAAERAALEVYTEDISPADRAYVQDDLGWTLAMIGQRTGEKGRLEEGKASIEASWAFYRASGQNLDEYFKARIAAIEGVLESLQ